MPIGITISGLSAESFSPTNAVGLIPLVTGEPVIADDMNATFEDLQTPTMYSGLPGVLSGGQCSAALLAVTIPAETIWYARQVWRLESNRVENVADAQTTYLWGCSDGLIRQTNTTTPPTDFTTRTACILCKIVASGGVALVDNTVQQRARYADASGRMVADTGGFMPEPTSVPTGMVFVVAEGHQEVFQCPYEVNGTLVINGRGKTEEW